MVFFVYSETTVDDLYFIDRNNLQVFRYLQKLNYILGWDFVVSMYLSGLMHKGPVKGATNINKGDIDIERELLFKRYC